MRKGIVMVAPRKTKKVFCTIVRVPANNDRITASPSRFSTRPSDLLPWADPYIARLVRNLQEEVRSERRTASSIRADLEPPMPSAEPDGGWSEDTRWTCYDDDCIDLLD